MTLCEVCGNEIAAQSLSCKYCGSRQNGFRNKKSPFLHRRVNIEQGKPVVEVAMERLLAEIKQAHCEKVNIITLIHGYGSSGKGGVIRKECRKILDYLKSRNTIKDYIPGEKFTRRTGSVKSSLQRFPQLEKDQNLNRGNRGITIVIL